jgi:hypothetical protein
MRWAGHVARMAEKRNVFRLLVGKPQGKRPLGIPRRRWRDNIEMDFFRDRVECCGLYCSGSGESSCELGNEPSTSIKCWETTEWPLVWYSAPQS